MLNLSRSEDFLAENEVDLVEFKDFDVELSFGTLAVELSFLSSTFERMPLDASFVEFVALPSVVLFFVDKLFLMSLVWFLEDWLGVLMSLSWVFVGKASPDFFFFGCSSSTDSKILLPLRNKSPFRDSESAHTHNREAAAKRAKTRKSRNTFLALKSTTGAICEIWILLCKIQLGFKHKLERVFALNWDGEFEERVRVSEVEERGIFQCKSWGGGIDF